MSSRTYIAARELYIETSQLKFCKRSCLCVVMHGVYFTLGRCAFAVLSAVFAYLGGEIRLTVLSLDVFNGKTTQYLAVPNAIYSLCCRYFSSRANKLLLFFGKSDIM